MIRFVLFLLMAWVVSAQAVLPLPKESWQAARTRTELHKIGLSDDTFSSQAEVLASALEALGAKKPPFDGKGRNVIRLEKNPHLGPEEYAISSNAPKASLILSASTTQGMARACASLLQLVAIEDKVISVSSMGVKDQPDLPYRSFMVDMGRNPHSPETLRRVVDMCWLAKVNYLQLHLTDDQMISWPSKAYPKLLSPNAGWTWQDFVDLEAYSQARGVTIIPELDVPGHSTILRKEYPDVFGKTPTDLASSESSLKGVQNLLDEFMQVFQATPYIHVGGDEAWDVDEKLQRDFINKLNIYVKSKERKTVVWEGPKLGEGENKVSEDVLHINWRTINFPAEEMLKAGYQVVNAAWDPLYIVDHYPRTMFTAVPVKTCYEWDLLNFKHVNPEIKTFAQPQRLASSKGIQGFCMPWWEGREQNLFALCESRLMAVAAAAWNRKGESSYESFSNRQKELSALLEKLNPNPHKNPTGGVANRTAPPSEGNLAHGKKVEVSHGASQPHFGPQRLTNGVTERFDHFLGYPTEPQPLEIVIDLESLEAVREIKIYEAAVGKSWEKYEVLISEDGKAYESISQTKSESRGEGSFVSHKVEKSLRYVKVKTLGCKDLTFPSFSRLCEVMVFAQ